MGSYYWIKVYHEVIHDPKMGMLSDHLWRRFFELCLLAGECDQNGYLPSVPDMAWTFRTSPGDMEADLHLLNENQLVTMDPDGSWFVTKFAERQAPLSDAERKQRQRDRDKKRDYYGHDDVTQDVTICDTDTDTDTDQNQTREDTDQNRGGTAAGAVLEDVHRLGVTDPKACLLVNAHEEVDELPLLVPRLRGWIDHYVGQDKVTNPIGLAITKVEAFIDPPTLHAPADDRKRYASSEFAQVVS